MRTKGDGRGREGGGRGSGQRKGKRIVAEVLRRGGNKAERDIYIYIYIYIIVGNGNRLLVRKGAAGDQVYKVRACGGDGPKRDPSLVDIGWSLRERVENMRTTTAFSPCTTASPYNGFFSARGRNTKRVLKTQGKKVRMPVLTSFTPNCTHAFGGGGGF